MSAAIVIADASGVIIFWPPAAERLLGHSASAVLGKTLDVIVPEEYRAMHWAGFKRALHSGHAKVEGEVGPFLVLQPDGRVLEIPGRLTLIRDAKGIVFSAMVVFG
ncbi:MAG: PAS domain-containing protein [Archangium sp.]